MNKEEIIKYLKEKIKTNQDFIETIEKIDNDSSKTKDDMIINSQNDIKYYEEIINYIEEKNKVIDEAIDYTKNHFKEMVADEEAQELISILQYEEGSKYVKNKR